MEIKRPSSNEMCPPGYHVVRGHERICHSGTRTWVDAHIRRNRGSIPKILLSENIHYLYWGTKKKYPIIGRVFGYPENREVDEVIHFWLDYWKAQGLDLSGIDPLLIKTIIAIESQFDPAAHSKDKRSSASGLMQITDQTRRILSGRPDSKGYREMKSGYLEISKSDIGDPIVNVAAGIRWLAHKRASLPKSSERTVVNVLKYYHSWDKAGEAYAKKVEELYKKSK